MKLNKNAYYWLIGLVGRVFANGSRHTEDFNGFDFFIKLYIRLFLIHLRIKY